MIGNASVFIEIQMKNEGKITFADKEKG